MRTALAICVGAAVVGGGLFVSTANAQSVDRPLSVLQAIRAEALRAPDDPMGRPLPLASHWNTGITPINDTFDPAYQIGLIEAGHYVLPFLRMPTPSDPASKNLSPEYYEAPLKKLAQWGLPFSLVSTQWESLLSSDKKYLDLPVEANPNAFELDGTVVPEVDAMGPVEPWREVGKKWTTNPGMQRLQALYPAPSLVLFVSNNEHAKVTWPEADMSKRYVDRFGSGTSDVFKRQVFAAGWIERYGALLAGMKDGLANTAWNGAATFIGYDAFGPRNFGRWPEWTQHSLYVPGRIDWSPLVWNGGSPSFYVLNSNASTDYTVWSPLIADMNWVFMQAEAARLNKRLWFEMSTWDGSTDTLDDKRSLYVSQGQTYNPARYSGTVRFGMWLTRPRVVREYRGWNERRS